MAQWDKKGMDKAYEEAMLGYSEGGVPIGGCLLDNETGEILGSGHNQRFQKGSPILHGETAALENAGRLKASVYRRCTMYTTLSPCDMCTGAMLLYGIGRVVVGENKNFKSPGEEYLVQRGVELKIVDDQRCMDIMEKFIAERPEDWYEDIGE